MTSLRMAALTISISASVTVVCTIPDTAWGRDPLNPISRLRAWD